MKVRPIYKMIFYLIAFIMGLLTVSFPSVYIFSFNREATMVFLEKIAIGRFWLLMIPVAFITFSGTCYFGWKMYTVDSRELDKDLKPKNNGNTEKIQA